MVALESVQPADAAAMEAEHRARARFLDRRILLVAAVLIGQLVVLAAAIDAWAEQRSGFLFGSLAFQLGCFLVSLRVGVTAGRFEEPDH